MIGDKPLRDALSANLPRLRQDRGLSQQALADQVGIHRVTIAKIEGGTLTPGGDLLYSLADALGVPTDTLRQVSSPTVA